MAAEAPPPLFHVDSVPRDYAASRAYCESRGMQIASVRTAAEQAELRGLVTVPAYLGASRTGEGWEDGAPWSFARFGPPSSADSSAMAPQQVSKTDAGSHAAAPDQPGVPPRPAPAQATVAARPRPRYVVTIHEYQGQESNDLRFGAGQRLQGTRGHDGHAL